MQVSEFYPGNNLDSFLPVIVTPCFIALLPKRRTRAQRPAEADERNDGDEEPLRLSEFLHQSSLSPLPDPSV